MQDLQNIIKSRSSGSSVSLFESFKQRAEEAAKIPAEILKAPTEAFQSAPEAPAIPLPITKALPQPTSKAAAGSAPVHVAHLVFVICTAVFTVPDVLPMAWKCTTHFKSFTFLWHLLQTLKHKYGCGCNKLVLACLLQEYGMLKEAAQTVL